MKWFIKCLNQYFDFKGRARRKEYWMFYLWTLIIEVLIIIVSLILGGGFPGIGTSEGVPPELMPRSIGMGMFFTGLLTLYGLALFIPQLSVTVRRLHDTGKPGWLLLVYYLLVFGGIGYIAYLTAKMTVTATADDFPFLAYAVLIAMALMALYLFIMMLKKGDSGSNRYGHNPKEDAF